MPIGAIFFGNFGDKIGTEKSYRAIQYLVCKLLAFLIAILPLITNQKAFWHQFLY